MSPTSQPHHLSLEEIASWQFPELQINPLDGSPRLIAALPSLQRGAVWKPGQIEMLWDSILRGFPVGSLVVCEKFEGQAVRSGRHGEGWNEAEVTHFLLDGQQRCNAIALAFQNALMPRSNGEEPVATLWIDLHPDPPKTSSTRRFVLRVLTIAHPWGYGLDDQASFIGVAAIREAVESHEGKKRPLVSESWPHRSIAPVPFSWLIEAVPGEADEGSLWLAILRQCEEAAVSTRPWALKAAALLKDHLDGVAVSPCLDEIETAMRKLGSYALLALQVPQEILTTDGASPGEPIDGSGNLDRIHQIEHLYQRLGSAGTELRGEELLFSMIKAYWPDIENSFAEITDREGRAWLPMPGSRLATLGIRAALMGAMDEPALPGVPSIPQIRAMAVARDDVSLAKRTLVHRYLGISVPPRESDLHANLRLVDDWLLFRPDTRGDIGLPPLLRSHLAQAAPEVYLLLLHLAQRARNLGLDEAALEILRKPVLALATTLHWFGLHQDKAVRHLIPVLHAAPLIPESFHGLLAPLIDPNDARSVLTLMDPGALADAVSPVEPTDGNLSGWTRWQSVVEAFETETPERSARECVVWPLLERVLSSKPLLLFAQRDYLARAFDGYDPSCIDVCNGHDRPWDYDHILPGAVLHSNQGVFREACRQWSESIGNLRAWPLEENRARRDEPADGISENDLGDSRIDGLEERSDFSMRWEEVGDPEKAARFMNAARIRSLRIYREWFESLDIARLLR